MNEEVTCEGAHKEDCPESELPQKSLPKKTSALRKWTLCVSLALGGALLLLVLLTAFCLGPLVKWGINTFGKTYLAAENVCVDKVEIYPFSGYFSIENFTIGKTKSFEQDVLSLKQMEIDVDVFSLLTEKILIERFVLKGLTFNYEKGFTGKDNIGELLEYLDPNLEEELAGTQTQENGQVAPSLIDQIKAFFDALINPPNSPATPEAENLYIGAEYLDVEGIKISANIGKIPLILPEISFEFKEGLGIDESLTPEEFAGKIALRIVNILRSVDFTALGKNALDTAGKAANFVGDSVGATVDLFGSAAGTASGAAVETVSGIADSISSLFKTEEVKDEKKKN